MDRRDEEEHAWPLITPQCRPHFPSLSADFALSLSSNLAHDELETQLIVYDSQNNPWNVIRRDPETRTVVLFSPQQKSVVVTSDNGERFVNYFTLYLIAWLTPNVALVLFDSEAVPQAPLLHRDYFHMLQDVNVMEQNRRGVRSEKSDDPHNISPESLNSGISNLLEMNFLLYSYHYRLLPEVLFRGTKSRAWLIRRCVPCATSDQRYSSRLLRPQEGLPRFA